MSCLPTIRRPTITPPCFINSGNRAHRFRRTTCGLPRLFCSTTWRCTLATSTSIICRKSCGSESACGSWGPQRQPCRLGEQSRDLVVPAPGCPREWRGPCRIVGQALRRAASEQEPDHLELPELGRPGERRRTEVLVTRRQIGAASSSFFASSTSPLRAASWSGEMRSQLCARVGQSSSGVPASASLRTKGATAPSACRGAVPATPTVRRPSFRPADSERRRARAGASRCRSAHGRPRNRAPFPSAHTALRADWGRRRDRGATARCPCARPRRHWTGTTRHRGSSPGLSTLFASDGS